MPSWGWRGDSNSRPPAYKAGALPLSYASSPVGALYYTPFVGLFKPPPEPKSALGLWASFDLQVWGFRVCGAAGPAVSPGRHAALAHTGASR